MRIRVHARIWSFLALALSSMAATCDPGGAQPDAAPPIDAPPIDARPPSDASIVDAASPPDAAAGDLPGCDGARFLPAPVDPTARGPYPVGARTVHVGALTAEVWYPAAPGSDRGAPRARYDLRAQLPASEAAKIPDDDNPWQRCDCARELPLDTAHGPYPGVVFVHGTASFRHQSLSQVTHWASRGFVVIAVDHPGLRLAHILARVCPGNPSEPQNLGRDIDAELTALRAPTGELSFLAGHVDGARLAVIGHSAGASAAAASTGKPGVRVVVSMAGNQAARAGTGLQRVLFLGGLTDAIVKWPRVQSAYASSATPRALVGLARAGHLAFSDLCQTRNAQDQNLLEIAREHGICGAALAGQLFDCSSAYLPGPIGWSIIDDASAIVLESTLQCRRDLPALSAIAERHADVADYQEAP